jgi:hypothetical protein
MGGRGLKLILHQSTRVQYKGVMQGREGGQNSSIIVLNNLWMACWMEAYLKTVTAKHAVVYVRCSFLIILV